MSEAKHAGRTEAGIDRQVPLLTTLVGDTTWFAAECWGRRPTVHRSLADFRHLLSGDAVCELLERATRRPHLRMVRDGTTLSPHDYTTSVRLGGTVTPDVADVERIAQQFSTGATLVLQSLERIHAPLSTYARELQREISHPVQTNAYLSPPSASALERHSDRHDVFVVQIEGSKSWDVAGLGSLELAEGDVLYIPSGCTHAATTTERHSLHLTVGVLSVTYGDVIRRAVRSLDHGTGQPLPLGFANTSTDGALSATIGDAIREVADGLLSMDPAEIGRSEQQRARELQRRPDDLRRELAMFDLRDASLIRVRPDAEVSTDDGATVLTFGDRELRMPAVAAPALHGLVRSRVATIGDLVGLDAASRLVLARRLLREGAAELLWRDGERASSITPRVTVT